MTQDHFNRLVRKWKAERDATGGITKLCNHPAYMEIVDGSWKSLPLILKEMQREPDHWFMALLRICGPASPVIPGDCVGNIRKMTDCWIAWGKEKKVI